jgi:hypothetical protein
MWKDLTPRVVQLFDQCLPLYHCATLTHDKCAKLLVAKNVFVIQTWQIYMKFRYIYLQTHLSKRVFFKLYIMWKDLTPRVFPLFSQCLPLYHCATLIHMIIGQNFWYLKLLFVIQTWQIYMNFRYIYLQTYDQKEWKDLTPIFSQCT